MKKDLEKLNIYNTTLDSINNNIIKFNNSLELISEINKTIIYNNQSGGTTQDQGNDSLNDKLDLLNKLILNMIANYKEIKSQMDANSISLEEIKQNNVINIENISQNNIKLNELNDMLTKLTK